MLNTKLRTVLSSYFCEELAMKKNIGVVQIRLPNEITMKIDKVAEGRLISRSDVIREAILRYLKEKKLWK